ncbi:hydroxymethylpyrimidine/phosphomethylpyrimidine kinase [Cnuella takakiae]|uniref:hydroxymethylpyrimidine kinase n=1 Tax=Cnuella takakiae TaxID=1302690 RepID=A0A1M5ER98_9BACT|nr:bifunctional hydroxymethylpyrimidine kinase/phosphomethylpyrimidine kinase [Cnuella takakiae]OLY91265.1 bifunctional hydroxymethylpyrimidine kinase/phosphomethylpyrimidine kinase [Cnuella takakiae]SHF81532.1 hydroxymethylpyrimidine/phosphomethylpyrimidine kinase [Cnuella takakiae]
MKYRYPVVLTIAGSDSGGGAGIQADLKTFSALGCFGTSAITAITAQNTLGVRGIHSIPADMVRQQIEAVLEDLQPAAIKIGMIHTAELATTIAQALQGYQQIPIILDPVMVATSGARLIEETTVHTLRELLFPLATLITPNLDEAAVLYGQNIPDVAAMQTAALALTHNCNAVLLKGGHLKGEKVFDVLAQKEGSTEVFASPYIESSNVHGTGCTLSAAIAAYMAQGASLHEAIVMGRAFIANAIQYGSDVQTGRGNGPLNHFFNPKPLQKYAVE